MLGPRRVIPSALERLQGVGRLNATRFVILQHSTISDENLFRLVKFVFLDFKIENKQDSTFNTSVVSLRKI